MGILWVAMRGHGFPLATLKGGDVSVTERLSRFMNIPIGVLPIKYLGIPLTSKKMSRVDCKALVDKITGRCIWGHRGLLYQNVEAVIGDGKSTFIWHDPWMEGRSLIECQDGVKKVLMFNDLHTAADVKMCSNG
ncbi:hypothetical protein Leryth_005046 [Lithospermum erythrorhizon]|nr:hypothetical protein Leryth_005046 [Lithospermum erythrorhizon]